MRLKKIPATDPTDISPITDELEKTNTKLDANTKAINDSRLSQAITEADLVRLITSLNTNTQAVTTELSNRINEVQAAILKQADPETRASKTTNQSQTIITSKTTNRRKKEISRRYR